jgi:fatty-acid desaturase
LSRDRFHAAMHRRYGWLAVWMAHAMLIFAGGWTFGYLSAGAWQEGLRVGLSWLAWGVFLRGVVVWHVTWSINSITHLWGYRTYKTTDDSRNNWLMGYLGFGEGWHNNHHADQRSARAGHRWWELDISYLTIRLFSFVGLARNIVTPARNIGTTHDIGRKRA